MEESRGERGTAGGDLENLRAASLSPHMRFPRLFPIMFLRQEHSRFLQEHSRFLKVGMLGQVHLLMIFCLLLGTALIYYVWRAKKEESA